MTTSAMILFTNWKDSYLAFSIPLLTPLLLGLSRLAKTSAHIENWTAQSNCIKIVKWIPAKSAMGASRYVHSDNKWPQGVGKNVVLMYYIDSYIYIIYIYIYIYILL